MDDRLTNLRSTKNPKARIKIMSGHFATRHSHVNTYIDMSTVKTRHNNARETARTLADEYDGGYDCMPQEHRSDRWIYGGSIVGQFKCIHERRK